MVVREFAAWGSWSRNRLGIVDKDTRACWALLHAVVKARNAVKDLVFTLCTVVLELCWVLRTFWPAWWLAVYYDILPQSTFKARLPFPNNSFDFRRICIVQQILFICCWTRTCLIKHINFCFYLLSVLCCPFPPPNPPFPVAVHIQNITILKTLWYAYSQFLDSLFWVASTPNPIPLELPNPLLEPHILLHHEAILGTELLLFPDVFA